MDRTFKDTNYNPFIKQTPAQPKVKQYTKPDPSKRQDCAEDRPIKINKSGKYNLNFIDWQNEFDAVMEADEKIMNGESPIYGMTIETFQAI